jgi:hypothetical protein
VNADGAVAAGISTGALSRKERCVDGAAGSGGTAAFESAAAKSAIKPNIARGAATVPTQPDVSPALFSAQSDSTDAELWS